MSSANMAFGTPLPPGTIPVNFIPPTMTANQVNPQVAPGSPVTMQGQIAPGYALGFVPMLYGPNGQPIGQQTPAPQHSSAGTWIRWSALLALILGGLAVGIVALCTGPTAKSQERIDARTIRIETSLTNLPTKTELTTALDPIATDASEANVHAHKARVHAYQARLGVQRIEDELPKLAHKTDVWAAIAASNRAAHAAEALQAPDLSNLATKGAVRNLNRKMTRLSEKFDEHDKKAIRVTSVEE